MFDDNYGLTGAVINGRKTKTRRLITAPKSHKGQYVSGFRISIRRDGTILQYPELLNDEEGVFDDGACIFPRYKINEIVAVAQAYKDIGFAHDDIMYREIDGKFIKTLACNMAGWNNKMFVTSEHMPHQVQITDIGIEKLQDISDEDCIAEGIKYLEDVNKYYFEQKDNDQGFYFDTPREAFASLIDKVCGKGIWKSNPWVFVYEFKLIK